jgi:transcription initiation factor TFIID subunit 4
MKELLQRQAQEKLQQKKLARPGAVPETTSTSNSVHTGVSLGKTTSVNIAGPASLSGSPGEQQPLNQHQKMNSTSVSVSPSTAPSATTSSSSSTASVPLPISTMSLTAQLREHLAKLTPQQQRAFYMQQLTTQSQRLPQNQQSQTSQQAQSSQQRVVVGAVSQQQAQVVSNARLSVSPLNSHTTSALSTGKVTATAKTSVKILEKQQQVSVGGVAVKQISSRLPVTSSVSANHLAAGKVAVGSPSKGGGIRSGFVDVKLAPAAAKLSSPPSSAAGKGKGKVKLEKNVADDEEEEDDEMDFSGVKTVNLQAESMLPSSLGDTMRTVRDQAFFDVQALKRRVLPIARRCGISDITDGYLVLLSHGIQERLKDVLEKVTIVSQHRTESLKDEGTYEVSSEVRGQLKVLESIDRLSHRRKMEKEKDQILKAAKSRSRAEDPEAAAKIKEQAKKLQQEEAQKIRDKKANEAALAALSAFGSGTKRKRPSPAEGVSSGLSGQDTGSGHTSLLGTQISRQPKRRITARDLLFYMEQTKETKKSLVLYKSLLK